MRKPQTGTNAELSRRLRAAFGSRLASLRRQVVPKVTQEAVAKALGVSRASVSNIENGRHRIFLDQLYILAKVVGKAPAELLPSEEAVQAFDSVGMAPDAGIAHHIEELQSAVHSAREYFAREPSESEEV